jgi:hypothetical protein
MPMCTMVSGHVIRMYFDVVWSKDLRRSDESFLIISASDNAQNLVEKRIPAREPFPALAGPGWVAGVAQVLDA